MTKKKQYVLRTCAADGTSHGGFKWPKRGKVCAPDWDAHPECGNGLHGALWGEGHGHLFSWSEDALWQVVRVDSELVDLDGKVKFESGYVVFTGTRFETTQKIIELGATGAVIGSTVSSGDRGTSTSGDHGTSTSGYRGTSTSGYRGTSTSGYDGTSTSGRYGTSTSGDHGTSTSGEYGTSTSGEYGTSTSGDDGTSTSGEYGTSTSGIYGTSTSGNFGTSTSGRYGTSTSGRYGTSTSGNFGTSTSGEYGIIQIKHWDGERYRLKVGYIGEDGLKPNTSYKLDEDGNFVEVKGQ